MNKGQLSNFLRRIGLMHFTDQLRYYAERVKNSAKNRAFKAEHSNVALPPDYLIYESFQLNYQKYYSDSIGTAKWLKDHFERHIELKNKRILDWGCGPGRIIRHLPAVIGNGCEFYGTDYNRKSIEWCKENLKGIQFNHNTLEAKLPYEDSFMDVIYGISIFTHLSEHLHQEWYRELHRILKPNGILFLTTQGDNFKPKLAPAELDQYENHQLVVRGNVKEGHRTYSAFHPREYMQKMFSNAEVLEHIEIPSEGKAWIPQDIWMIRKQ